MWKSVSYLDACCASPLGPELDMEQLELCQGLAEDTHRESRQPSRISSEAECSSLGAIGAMKPAWDTTQACAVVALELDVSSLPQGQRLGVTFWSDRGFLNVKSVLRDGFLEHWNCANPDARLGPHDRIFAANGHVVTCDDANLLRFADRGGRLRLLIIKSKRIFRWTFADEIPRTWSALQHPSLVAASLAELDERSQRREVVLADQEDEERPFPSVGGAILFLEQAAAR